MVSIFSTINVNKLTSINFLFLQATGQFPASSATSPKLNTVEPIGTQLEEKSHALLKITMRFSGTNPVQMYFLLPYTPRKK